MSARRITLFLVIALIVTNFGISVPLPPPSVAVKAAEGVQSEQVVPFEQLGGLLAHVEAGIVADADSASQRELRNIRKLYERGLAGDEAEREKLAVKISRRLNALGDLVAKRSGPRQDEIGVRHEPTLGKPDCPYADTQQAHCLTGEWLATRSPNFVNIRKTSYLRGTSEHFAGVQMSSSFVVERDGTHAAMSFAAEAYVEGDAPGLRRRLFVRALIDGAPADPSDVVFATSEHQGVRSFTFTKLLDAGIHTVEIQWMVDRDATAYLRDASLLIQTGRSIASAHGTLYAASAPSGPSATTTSGGWADIPDMSGWVYVPANGVLAASMSGETFVNGSTGQRMFLRALVDGVPAEPGDVVFARGSRPQARTMVFGRHGLAKGWHEVRFQWLVDREGKAGIGDRSLVLAAYPSPTYAPTHPFVVAASGVNISVPGGVNQPIPGMSTSVLIPEQGNGEVAVQFSAETGSTNGVVAVAYLAVDGVIQADQMVTLTDGAIQAHVKHFVFSAKKLTPGSHQLEIWWTAGNGGSAIMGDRTMAVTSEVGAIPDLAEPAPFAGGRLNDPGDNPGGIEPLIGERPVLTILWDPHRCDDAEADEPCVDQNDLSVAEVEAALYGPAGDDGGDNVRDFFLRMSGDRFTIANAGVLGWYDADEPADHYWSHPWTDCDTSQDGFVSGHGEKLAEAVGKADAAFDFSQYDRNADGTVDAHELAIVVVIPQPNGDGSSIQSLVASHCPDARMTLDGVVLPQKVAEWYTSLDDSFETYQFTTGAHELLHLIAGLDDMYVGEDHATYPRNLSVMSNARWTSSQLDPLSKLALGWVTPRTITADGVYTVEDVSTSEQVYILPRYNSTRADEFYVFENRRDLNVALHDDNGIGDSGIAVWHIVTDAVDMQARPIGVTSDAWNTNAAAVAADDLAMYGKGTQARWGIRLLRSFEQLAMDGTALFDSKDNTLWDASEYDLLSAPCPALYLGPGFFAPNVLAWADCTASGYHIEFLTAPGAQMQVEVTID